MTQQEEILKLKAEIESLKKQLEDQKQNELKMMKHLFDGTMQILDNQKVTVFETMDKFQNQIRFRL